MGQQGRDFCVLKSMLSASFDDGTMVFGEVRKESAQDDCQGRREASPMTLVIIALPCIMRCAPYTARSSYPAHSSTDALLSR